VVRDRPTDGVPLRRGPHPIQAFLDRSYMAYSMAYYGEEPEAIRASSASLVEAQRAKLALICERAGVHGTNGY